MRIILLGPPGSGKGTQALLLSQGQHLEHISSGDLLRAAVRDHTPVGLQAEPYLKRGELAPTSVVNGLIAERFAREDRPSRFVMDGYPRTRDQAVAFDEVLEKYQLQLSGVVLFVVPDDELLRRLSGRWSCPNGDCMATYHLPDHSPDSVIKCEHCGTELIQREDDKLETIQARLAIYRTETAELIPFYRERKLLYEINGVGNMDEIQERIVGHFEGEGS